MSISYVPEARLCSQSLEPSNLKNGRDTSTDADPALRLFCARTAYDPEQVQLSKDNIDSCSVPAPPA